MSQLIFNMTVLITDQEQFGIYGPKYELEANNDDGRLSPSLILTYILYCKNITTNWFLHLLVSSLFLIEYTILTPLLLLDRLI